MSAKRNVFMIKIVLVFLTVAVAGATGCHRQSTTFNAQLLGISRGVPGESANISMPDHGQTLSLMRTESMDLDHKTFESITQFDPNQGIARLADGRCIEFRREKSVNGKLGGAIITSGNTTCSGLPQAESGMTGLPCHPSQLSKTVGGWQLRCTVLQDGRSNLVAVDATSSIESHPVQLATLSEKVRLVRVFGVHQNAVVTTLGWNRDGKIKISWFSWVTN
jgi:hypothetical protein